MHGNPHLLKARQPKIYRTIQPLLPIFGARFQGYATKMWDLRKNLGRQMQASLSHDVAGTGQYRPTGGSRHTGGIGQ